jgi:hypothetical protein
MIGDRISIEALTKIRYYLKYPDIFLETPKSPVQWYLGSGPVAKRLEHEECDVNGYKSFHTSNVRDLSS